MKKLDINYPGKTQFAIDDVLWMQNAYMETMYDIVRATGADNKKLHGCFVSTSEITAGAVIIGGEICRVDAQQGSFDTGTWWLQKQTTYDATGDRLFLDGTPNGTQRQVFEITKAIPVQSATQPVDSIPIDAAYVFDHVHEAIDVIESSSKQFVSDSEKNAWNSKADIESIFIVGDTGVAFGTDFVPSTANGAVSLRYYKQGRIVTIEGAFGSVSQNSDVLIFQLPIGYRPPGNIVAKLLADEGTDASFHISSDLFIHSDGQVLINPDLYSYGFSVGYILISFIV